LWAAAASSALESEAVVVEEEVGFVLLRLPDDDDDDGIVAVRERGCWCREMTSSISSSSSSVNVAAAGFTPACVESRRRRPVEVALLVFFDAGASEIRVSDSDGGAKVDALFELSGLPGL
jgi:hypothetical protein